MCTLEGRSEVRDVLSQQHSPNYYPLKAVCLCCLDLPTVGSDIFGILQRDVGEAIIEVVLSEEGLRSMRSEGAVSEHRQDFGCFGKCVLSISTLLLVVKCNSITLTDMSGNACLQENGVFWVLGTI